MIASVSPPLQSLGSAGSRRHRGLVFSGRWSVAGDRCWPLVTGHWPPATGAPGDMREMQPSIGGLSWTSRIHSGTDARSSRPDRRKPIATT